MSEFAADIAYSSLNKYGELLCGDCVEKLESEDGTVIVVLADGLGSGVKANILSTLTAKIISTMVAQSMPISECVRAIAATLPVCDVRKVAYSTFTIIRISKDMEAEIIQYDNPHVILFRGGIYQDIAESCEVVDGKSIYRSRLKLREFDTLFAVSDGVIHAGVGRTLNFGWQREDIIQYMQRLYNKDFTAKMFSAILLEECNTLYNGHPGDDTTVCAIKIRRRFPVNLMIGPPARYEDTEKMMSLFFAKEGRHIVCGGTTSSLAAEHLGKELIVGIPKYVDPDIPPTAKIEGVDLVTEGVITINRVLSYAQSYRRENGEYLSWIRKEDGASQIARMLFEEATDINFYVGRAVNPAHQNPDLPIDFSIKMRLVDELAAELRNMGKRIKVSYF
ncbi:MAG: SpoIIE family protein phosphatase [Christensenellaceae bacterium]|jgi:hypothetical protein